MKKKRLVYVEWTDSHELYGWRPPSDLLDHEMICYSVGWLMEETKDRIVLGPTVGVLNGPGYPHATGAIAIPKVAIKHMYPLALPGRAKFPI